jgi:hypothetical protein
MAIVHGNKKMHTKECHTCIQRKNRTKNNDPKSLPALWPCGSMGRIWCVSPGDEVLNNTLRRVVAKKATIVLNHNGKEDFYRCIKVGGIMFNKIDCTDDDSKDAKLKLTYRTILVVI